jgi:hypothetical protein
LFQKQSASSQFVKGKDSNFIQIFPLSIKTIKFDFQIFVIYIFQNSTLTPRERRAELTKIINGFERKVGEIARQTR